MLFVFTACHEDEPDPTYRIILGETEITADHAGIRKRIEVTSDCDWRIGLVPEWCTVRKTVEGTGEFLDVEVLPNDTDNPRETTVSLTFSKDRSHNATAALSISQTGKPGPDDPMQWNPFAMNTLTSAEYELLGDNVTRRYRITGDRVFITPSFGKQVFVGNLIDRRTDNRKLTDYRDRYTFNPVLMGPAQKTGKDYWTQAVPSSDAMDKIARQLIADLPEQSLTFGFSGPVQYYSHRHLHLLGVGNLGLSLDETVSGRPYTQKEMEKKTGMIYTCSHELFRICMDYPFDKLVEEAIDGEALSDMSYVNAVSYGIASLLLVESDDDFLSVKSLLNGMFRGRGLNEEELKVRDALDVWYIRFDKYGAHPTRGNYELIERSREERNPSPTEIIPINFTTNRLEDNSVGYMEIGFDLP